MRRRLLLVLAASAAVLPNVARANDGAAEVGVGGIQLREERRIAMRKERLFVSLDRVEVEYEFVNESKEDVVTEVAFPIPEIAFSPVERIGHRFNDFRVWVDGQPVQVAEDAKALVGDEDVSGKLKANGFQSVAGSIDEAESLSKEQLERLHSMGLVGSGADDPPDSEERYWPSWSVRIVYHWRQLFPAGKVVTVRHQYAPATGVTNHVILLEDACVEPALARRLLPAHSDWETYWVRYILTTANTWKTPLGEFELVIERPEGFFVSLCWDGPLRKIGPRTFRVTAKNYVPSRDLSVYFFGKSGLSHFR